uniref:Beta-galactosidase n=1 Tax=Opalinidae sp. TaxID=2059444 RepID=A0A649UZG6_9STRA|nr:beta-galactosidase [Opalinidae sp.]
MYIAVLLLLLTITICCGRKIELSGEQILKDGEPFRIISGSMHYFRHHPDQWEDRILKLKAMGLNTISTYVAWNLHNPEIDEYYFESIANIELFIQIVQRNNMYLLLRPGPYICAEWELGGIPYWVLGNENIQIRTSNQLWLNEVNKWYKVFFGKISKYLYSNGGNIIFVQVENEYGFYGCDHKYIEWLYNETYQYVGDNNIIYTTDAPDRSQLNCASYSKSYTTVDFGVRDAKPAFNLQREFQKTGPYMNSEFYPGWLSHWKDKYPRVDTTGIINTMVQMLDLGASFNFYMAIGGTNFGFYAGANGEGNSIQVDTTSYDYDAPLSEAGDCTSKCIAIRNKLQDYYIDSLPKMPPNTTKMGYGDIKFTKSSILWDNLALLTTHTVSNDLPLNFEKLNIAYGYVIYESYISDTSSNKKLKINSIRDLVIVYINDLLVTKLEREQSGKEINIGNMNGKLLLLVENNGRINFGGGMIDRKGISGVYVNNKLISNWKMSTLPMNNKLNEITFSSTIIKNGPTFYWGSLFKTDDIVADTWIDVRGWSKGHIYVNGFNIGKYWEPSPPQHALFVPGPLLVKGVNEIIVFDQDHCNDDAKMVSIDHPLLE